MSQAELTEKLEKAWNTMFSVLFHDDWEQLVATRPDLENSLKAALYHGSQLLQKLKDQQGA